MTKPTKEARRYLLIRLSNTIEDTNLNRALILPWLVLLSVATSSAVASEPRFVVLKQPRFEEQQGVAALGHQATMSCDEFSDTGRNDILVSSWIAGYISSSNRLARRIVASRKQDGRLVPLTLAAFHGWIVDWCSANAKVTLYEAMTALEEELAQAETIHEFDGQRED